MRYVCRWEGEGEGAGTPGTGERLLPTWEKMRRTAAGAVGGIYMWELCCGQG